MMRKTGSDKRGTLVIVKPIAPTYRQLAKAGIGCATTTFVTVLNFVPLLIGGTPVPWPVGYWSGVWKQGVWRSKHGPGAGQFLAAIGLRDRVGPRPSLKRNNFGFFGRKFALFQRHGIARDRAAQPRILPVVTVACRSHAEAEARSI